jgi:hypothetical protein
MEAEHPAAAVAADLQDLARGHRERRPPAVVEVVGIGNERAQRVVAAGEIQDDEVPSGRSLRARQVAEKRRRREPDRERGHAAAEEVSTSQHLSPLATFQT